MRWIKYQRSIKNNCYGNTWSADGKLLQSYNFVKRWENTWWNKKEKGREEFYQLIVSKMVEL